MSYIITNNLPSSVSLPLSYTILYTNTSFNMSLGGDGVMKLHQALMELSEGQIARDRERFSLSPSPCASELSETTTSSPSPEPFNGEDRERFQWRRQLLREHAASKPRRQFKDQRDDEALRLWRNDNPTSAEILDSIGDIGGLDIDGLNIKRQYKKVAGDAVKARWIDQGIWMKGFEYTATGKFKSGERWGHEGQSEEESPMESLIHTLTSSVHEDTQTNPEYIDPHGSPMKSSTRLSTSKSHKSTQANTEGFESEASLPISQFFYQVCEELQRMLNAIDDNVASPADISTTAYEVIKKRWIKRGIWNEKWRIIPGMAWKHKFPLSEEDSILSKPDFPMNPTEETPTPSHQLLP